MVHFELYVRKGLAENRAGMSGRVSARTSSVRCGDTDQGAYFINVNVHSKPLCSVWRIYKLSLFLRVKKQKSYNWNIIITTFNARLSSVFDFIPSGS